MENPMTSSHLARPSTLATDSAFPLMLDFLEWLAPHPRVYPEVMEGWRTSCPRLPVWEDAVDARYVIRRRDAAGDVVVELSPGGRTVLIDAGRLPKHD